MASWTWFLADPPYVGGRALHLLMPVSEESVCRQLTKLLISLVLDDIFFWIFWRHSLDVGTLVPNNSCMSFSLLVGLLPYWHFGNIGISPVLDEIYFWNFLVTFIDKFGTFLIIFGLLFVSLVVSFWDLLVLFVCFTATISKKWKSK